MKMTVNVVHGLDHDTARKKLDARVAMYDQKYPQYGIAKSYQWLSPTVIVGGARGATGRVTFGDRELTVELNLPWILWPFRARIEQFIKQEILSATQAPG